MLVPLSQCVGVGVVSSVCVAPAGASRVAGDGDAGINVRGRKCTQRLRRPNRKLSNDRCEICRLFTASVSCTKLLVSVTVLCVLSIYQ